MGYLPRALLGLLGMSVVLVQKKLQKRCEKLHKPSGSNLSDELLRV